MNNQIWLMTSAFRPFALGQIIAKAKETGVQGLEICVFPRGGSRSDQAAPCACEGDTQPEKPGQYLIGERLKENDGYVCHDNRQELKTNDIKDIPVVAMKDLL